MSAYDITIAINSEEDLIVKRPSGSEVYMIPNIPVVVVAMVRYLNKKYGEGEEQAV